jgi:aspartate-semialdehyde dehydrogenase
MRKRVAVVGATGIAGQQFLLAPAEHPWFEIVALVASERSAGKTYGAALRDARTGARRWWCADELRGGRGAGEASSRPCPTARRWAW